jgi:hypothetical protein
MRQSTSSAVDHPWLVQGGQPGKSSMISSAIESLTYFFHAFSKEVFLSSPAPLFSSIDFKIQGLPPYFIRVFCRPSELRRVGDLSILLQNHAGFPNP